MLLTMVLWCIVGVTAAEPDVPDIAADLAAAHEHRQGGRSDEGVEAIRR